MSPLYPQLHCQKDESHVEMLLSTSLGNKLLSLKIGMLLIYLVMMLSALYGSKSN